MHVNNQTNFSYIQLNHEKMQVIFFREVTPCSLVKKNTNVFWKNLLLYFQSTSKDITLVILYMTQKF